MSIYGRWVFPRLIDWTMRAPQLSEHRCRVVGHARGQVLEVGIGSGANLPLYGADVERLVGLDPSTQLLGMPFFSRLLATALSSLVEAAGADAPFAVITCDAEPLNRFESPSAKIRGNNEVMLLFSVATAHYRKIPFGSEATPK